MDDSTDGGVVMEEILRVKISELTTIRIQCAGCGCTVEMPLSQVAQYAGSSCKICGVLLITSETNQQSTALTRLSQDLKMLIAMKNSVGIEFVIPQDGKKKEK